MLSISTKKNENGLEVALIGEVDVYSVDMLKEKVQQMPEEAMEEIVFNLEKLDYIDSTGLGALIGVKKKYPQATIRVVDMKSNVARLFDITGLNKIFVIE
ncbi:MAG TPA: anti-sigma factor antagonist [Eubacteriaceae bacterium]|nr:anti-sigma factor antagonist [Eubacteriaceae bacterium]